MHGIGVTFLTVLLLCAATLSSADDEAAEYFDYLIHSDVPLWAYDADAVWPKHINDPDSLGCASLLPLGHWKLKAHQGKKAGNESWVMIELSGPNHCYYRLTLSDERVADEPNAAEPAFLVQLTETNIGTETFVLWALQIGARPGSDYWLLSQKKGQAMTSLTILQSRCPAGKLRSGPDLDILVTKYCAINSQDAIIELAKEMAKIPPAGTFTRFRPAPE